MGGREVRGREGVRGEGEGERRREREKEREREREREQQPQQQQYYSNSFQPLKRTQTDQTKWNQKTAKLLSGNQTAERIRNNQSAN